MIVSISGLSKEDANDDGICVGCREMMYVCVKEEDDGINVRVSMWGVFKLEEVDDGICVRCVWGGGK